MTIIMINFFVGVGEDKKLICSYATTTITTFTQPFSFIFFFQQGLDTKKAWRGSKPPHLAKPPQTLKLDLGFRLVF